MEKLFKTSFISENNVQDVIYHALGWVKRETDVLLEQEKSAFLTQDHFQKEMTAFVRKIDRQLILKSYAPNPTKKQIETDLDTRTYVKQIDAIELDYDDKLAAVNDFLRASADRTAWSDKGLVHESSFDNFEEELKKVWKNIKRASDVELSDKEDVLKGKHLYSKCSLHNNKIEGMDIPNHFTSGSFQALSDEKIIGWHPDYKNKLKSLDDGKNK